MMHPLYLHVISLVAAMHQVAVACEWWVGCSRQLYKVQDGQWRSGGKAVNRPRKGSREAEERQRKAEERQWKGQA